MDVSIVIVNWNTCELLKACLRSISSHPPSGDWEIIVVDNGSSDGSPEMVRSEFPRVQLINNTENLGYAHGNNQGVSASRGRYILLLNPDTEVTPGAIDAMVRFAINHQDTAAVGCRLISPDGTVQRSCRGFPQPVHVLFEYLKLSAIFPRSKVFGAYRMTYFDYSSDAEVDQPMGSCLLISRAAWTDVGLFDEEFPIFFNDVDWCYRAKQNGWKIRFTATAEVIHHGGASTSQVKPQMVKESHRALRRFYEKHYRTTMPRAIFWLIILSIEINSIVASRYARVHTTK